LNIEFPLNDRSRIRDLKAGAEVSLGGTIYTARDRVHELIESGKASWPFELNNNLIYYCGPTPEAEGFPMGSCGPTTSARMDKYAAELYRKGLAATVGKGPRSKEVARAVRETGGVYFVAAGGCGALYGSRVKKAEIIAFEEFGPQAVYRVTVKDFPVVVGIDSRGESIFDYEL